MRGNYGSDTGPIRRERLAEAVSIGPKVARNRFYLAPHGLGIGLSDPERPTQLRCWSRFR